MLYKCTRTMDTDNGNGHRHEQWKRTINSDNGHARGQWTMDKRQGTKARTIDSHTDNSQQPTDKTDS